MDCEICVQKYYESKKAHKKSTFHIMNVQLDNYKQYRKGLVKDKNDLSVNVKLAATNRNLKVEQNDGVFKVECFANSLASLNHKIVFEFTVHNLRRTVVNLDEVFTLDDSKHFSVGYEAETTLPGGTSHTFFVTLKLNKSETKMVYRMPIVSVFEWNNGNKLYLAIVRELEVNVIGAEVEKKKHTTRRLSTTILNPIILKAIATSKPAIEDARNIMFCDICAVPYNALDYHDVSLIHQMKLLRNYSQNKTNFIKNSFQFTVGVGVPGIIAKKIDYLVKLQCSLDELADLGNKIVIIIHVHNNNPATVRLYNVFTLYKSNIFEISADFTPNEVLETGKAQQVNITFKPDSLTPGVFVMPIVTVFGWYQGKEFYVPVVKEIHITITPSQTDDAKIKRKNNEGLTITKTVPAPIVEHNTNNYCNTCLVEIKEPLSKHVKGSRHDMYTQLQDFNKYRHILVNNRSDIAVSASFIRDNDRLLFLNTHNGCVIMYSKESLIARNKKVSVPFDIKNDKDMDIHLVNAYTLTPTPLFSVDSVFTSNQQRVLLTSGQSFTVNISFTMDEVIEGEYKTVIIFIFVWCNQNNNDQEEYLCIAKGLRVEVSSHSIDNGKKTKIKSKEFVNTNRVEAKVKAIANENVNKPSNTSNGAAKKVNVAIQPNTNGAVKKINVAIEPKTNGAVKKVNAAIQPNTNGAVKKVNAAIQPNTNGAVKKVNAAIQSNTNGAVKKSDILKQPHTKSTIVRKKPHKNLIEIKKYFREMLLSDLHIIPLEYVIPVVAEFEVTEKMFSYEVLICEKLRASLQLWYHESTDSYIPTSEKYNTNMHTLLWADEIALMLNQRRYNMKSVPIRVTCGKLIEITVPGLAEKRPSLLLGDTVTLKLPGSSQIFDGEIFLIRQNQIYIKKFPSDIFEYAKSKFDVTFHFCRVSYIRSHQSVDFNSKYKPYLFPNPTVNDNPNLELKPELFNKSISSNPEQYAAIVNMLNNTSQLAPYVLFGPPGTGKTATLVETVLQITNHFPEKVILIAAPSNKACDNITTKLLTSSHVFNKNTFCRIYSDSYDENEIAKHIIPYSNKDTRTTKKANTLKIAIFTLVHSAMYKEDIKGDILVVDEAAQATESELSIPLAMLKNGGQLILAGDPKQLGPILNSPLAEKFGLGVSFLKRLISTNELYMRKHSSYLTMLKKNYRSHKEIIKVPNKKFYDNLLVAASVSAQNDKISNICLFSETYKSPGNNVNGYPIEFWAVNSKEEQDGNSPSFFNALEVQGVEKLVKKLLHLSKTKVKQEDIGVITPYNQQVQKIRKALTSFPDVEVGSVEIFQGREKRIIIISTVRARHELLEHDKKFCLGFVKSPERFNVAVTRAIAKLVIIGNPLVLSTDNNWTSLMDQCKEHFSYFDEKSAKDNNSTQKNVEPMSKYSNDISKHAVTKSTDESNMSIKKPTSDVRRKVESTNDSELPDIVTTKAKINTATTNNVVSKTMEKPENASVLPESTNASKEPEVDHSITSKAKITTNSVVSKMEKPKNGSVSNSLETEASAIAKSKIAEETAKSKIAEETVKITKLLDDLSLNSTNGATNKKAAKAPKASAKPSFNGILNAIQKDYKNNAAMSQAGLQYENNLKAFEWALIKENILENNEATSDNNQSPAVENETEQNNYLDVNASSTSSNIVKAKKIKRKSGSSSDKCLVT